MPTSAFLWQVVVTFLASSLGALVAGYAGVRFAMARLRRERSFDRRLTWYEEMLSATYELAVKFDDLSELDPNETDVYAWYDAQMRSHEARFNGLVAAATAYGTPSSCEALRKAVGTLLHRVETLDPKVEEAQQQLICTASAVLRESAKHLASEMRLQLGLEPIREDVWPLVARPEGLTPHR